jgi:hypothetical protein
LTSCSCQNVVHAHAARFTASLAGGLRISFAIAGTLTSTLRVLGRGLGDGFSRERKAVDPLPRSTTTGAARAS